MGMIFLFLFSKESASIVLLFCLCCDKSFPSTLHLHLPTLYWSISPNQQICLPENKVNIFRKFRIPGKYVCKPCTNHTSWMGKYVEIVQPTKWWLYCQSLLALLLPLFLLFLLLNFWQCLHPIHGSRNTHYVLAQINPMHGWSYICSVCLLVRQGSTVLAEIQMYLFRVDFCCHCQHNPNLP